MLAPIELLLLPLTACLPYPSWPVPAAGPLRASLLSDLLACGAGSVFVRREKKPNLLPGLGAGAGAGSVLDRRVSRSFWLSKLMPCLSALDVDGMLDVGTGEGFRDDVLTGTAIRVFAIAREPNLESVELVRLWWFGKPAMLL